MMISTDLNRHVGTDNTCDQEVKGRFGIRERNAEGQLGLDFGHFHPFFFKGINV